jgi:predicted amino acid racemase
MAVLPYEKLVKDVNVRYLDAVIRRNPGLIDAAIQFHRSGQIPPNTYLLDLDAFRANARATSEEARRHSVSLYYMTKQIGRNPLIADGVVKEGFRGVVCVDVQCAKTLHRYGVTIGHVGHLVQIPAGDIDYVLDMEPEVWTVYGVENAKLISKRAEKRNKKQKLLVQPVGAHDLFFECMAGGIPEADVVKAVAEINDLPGVEVVGTTSFPCLMFDTVHMDVRPISNFHTAVKAARELEEKLGIEISQINVPGSTGASTMKTISAAGGTHGEPGTSVCGANASQLFTEEPEIPGFVYVTEVSHTLGEKLYLHGGGLAHAGGGYGTYDDKFWVGGPGLDMQALVGNSFDSAVANRVRAKPPIADPFNYNLTLLPEGRTYHAGDTAVYGFSSPQIFTTRGWHAVVEGVKENRPRLLGIFDQGDNLIDRHGRLLGEKAVKDIIEKI